MNSSYFSSLRNFLSIMFFLLLIPACGKNNLHNNVELNSSCNKHKLLSAEVALLHQAKYSDIPIPVGFKAVSVKSKQNVSAVNTVDDFLCFGGTMSFDNVIEFYRKALEREGWEVTDVSHESEGLLWCCKINKSCAISIRPEYVDKTSYNTYVYIFIKKKLHKQTKLSDGDINSKQAKL